MNRTASLCLVAEILCFKDLLNNILQQVGLNNMSNSLYPLVVTLRTDV